MILFTFEKQIILFDAKISLSFIFLVLVINFVSLWLLAIESIHITSTHSAAIMTRLFLRVAK